MDRTTALQIEGTEMKTTFFKTFRTFCYAFVIHFFNYKINSEATPFYIIAINGCEGLFKENLIIITNDTNWEVNVSLFIENLSKNVSKNQSISLVVT